MKAGARGARQAGIVELEAAIHISNVALVDPKSDKPTRVGIRTLPMGRGFASAEVGRAAEVGSDGSEQGPPETRERGRRCQRAAERRRTRTDTTPPRLKTRYRRDPPDADVTS